MKKIFILTLFLALGFGFGLNYALAQEVVNQDETAVQELMNQGTVAEETIGIEAADQETAAAEPTEITEAVAVEAVVAGEEITTQDLEVENPGLLPTSRFYFLKNWTRAVKRVFTFNPVKKAELELNIVNEQAAELKAIEEIAPERIDAISKAAENYQINVEKLKNKLEALKETSENPNVDKLLEKLADRSIKHQQLFDELKQKFEDKNNLKQKFEEMQGKMGEIIAKIPEKFENQEAFVKRMEKALENQPERVYKELRGIEIIDKIEDGLREERRGQFENVKKDLLKNFESRIEGLTEMGREEILKPEILEKLPGDLQQRLKILEEIKSQVKNPVIGEKLKEASEGILAIEVEKKEIKKEAVEKIITETRSLIVKAESALSADVAKEVKDVSQKLIIVSKNRLAEAEKALSENKIGEAFGQAIAARAAAQNALRGVTAPILQEKMIIRQQVQPGVEVLQPSSGGAVPIGEGGVVQPRPETIQLLPGMTNTDAINPLPKILPISRCGDGICDLIEKERGVCLIDCR